MPLGLKLYLATASRSEDRRQSEPVRSEAVRLARPAGRLVWFHISSNEQISPIKQLISELAERMDQTSFLITTPIGTTENLHLQNICDQPCIDLATPAESPKEIAAFLDHWLPDIVIWSGSSLRPALLVATHAHNIPMIMVNACKTAYFDFKMRWKNSVIDSLLKLYSKLFACDGNTANLLIRQGADKESTYINGALDQNQPASYFNDGERDVMAEIIGPRPIWFATKINTDEIEIIISAHKEASKKSHRLLLIISLKHADQENELAEKLHNNGWIVAQQSLDQQPDENVQVFIVGIEEEPELWLRLSSVCFLGNSLNSNAIGTAPYQAAALGSAIMHGPFVTSYQSYYKKLESAGATHMVETAADLTLGVQKLLAPDIAAKMAHAGWEVSSSGAVATQTVLDYIINTLDELEQV